jgi:hypothetical protein
MHAEINSRKNPKICRNSSLEIIIIFFFFDFPASSTQAHIYIYTNNFSGMNSL